MPVFAGQMSYLRYQVVGEVKSPFLETLETALSFRRFTALKPEGEDVETAGWVPVQRPFGDDIPLTNDLFLFGERVVLGYREDQFAYPKQLLKDLVQERVDKHREKYGERPSAQTKHAIQLAVRSELRFKMLPKSRVVEVLWDMDRREVRFFARGKGLSDRFADFFQETFEVGLTPMGFSQWALNEDLSLRSRGHLETMRPIEIFPKRIVVEAEG